MSTQEHVSLDSGLGPSAVADWFAPLLRMEIRRGDEGEVYLTRPARAAGGDVGGEIYQNFLADPGAEPDDVSLPDGFATIFES